MLALLKPRMPVHGEMRLPECSSVVEWFASLKPGRFSLCALDSAVWMFSCPPQKDVHLMQRQKKQCAGVNGLSAASKSCCAGGMVSFPALLLRFLFSAIMLCKAALISNFFQTICFLFTVSCWLYRPEEQAGAANCLPGLAFSCHSALQPECPEYLSATLEDRKPEDWSA